MAYSMDKKGWCAHCADDTKQMAAILATCVQPADCIELKGDLGAGKTQFVQGLAAGLGISECVVSPTFNILLTYPQGRIPLFHFDVYRLDDPLELEDIGYYDVLDDEGVVCIEWGDKFVQELPEDRLVVCIRRTSAMEADKRVIEIAGTGNRANELREQWEAMLAKSFERGSVNAQTN